MKKIILIAAGVVVCAGIFFGTTWLVSLRQSGAEPADWSCVLAPGDRPELGESVTYRCRFYLPLCGTVANAAVQMPSGAVSGGPVLSHIAGYYGTRFLRELIIRVNSLHPGEVKGQKLTFNVSYPGGKSLSFAKELPAFTVVPLANPETDLQLAGAVRGNGGSRAHYIWLGTIVALLLGGMVWWLWHRRHDVAEELVAPWVRTAMALAGLRREIKERRISLEAAFVRLTDLVRLYLEDRYNIAASNRTTEEFLLEMGKDNVPLPEADKPFLREFLTSVELIKFARADADELMLLNAIKGAEDLVGHTAETEMGGENV